MSPTIATAKPGLLARWHATAAALEAAAPLWLLLLLARISVGAVFFRSGLLKIESWQTTLVLFRDEYQAPLLPYDLAAQLATACELAMPVLLAVGFAARLATLPLLGMIAVIQTFVYPDAWTDHLLWTTLLLLVLTRGPGALSLDRLIGIEPAGYGTRR